MACPACGHGWQARFDVVSFLWSEIDAWAGRMLRDVHTLDEVPSPERLELNDIGVVHLRLSEPLCVDPYEENRATGAFVLIDEATNETVGAGMVLSAS